MTTTQTRVALLAVCAAATLTACGAGRSPLSQQAPPASLSTAALHPPLAIGAAYRRTVETEVSLKLHTTVARLRSQLRAAPGSTLMTMAKPLGIAQDELGSIVLASLDDAAAAAVRSGQWPLVAAGKEKRYWRAQPAPSLIAEVSRWLIES